MTSLRNIKLKSLFAPILLIIVTVATYIGNVDAYFQQDEWLAFSRLFILKEVGLYNAIVNILTPTAGHYTPLNLFVLLGEFLAFGLNFKGYIIASILYHCIVVLLVYYLVKQLTDKPILPILAGAVFAVLASISQATNWVMADLGTHFSTLFTLLSLIFIFKFTKSTQRKYFVLSISFLFVSLLFKEISLAVFGILPLVIILFTNKKLKGRTYYILLPILVLLLYIGARVILIKLSPTASGLSTSAIDKTSIVYNLATISYKGFTESVIPYQVGLEISRYGGIYLTKFLGLGLIPGTWQFEKFVEETVYEATNILFFVVVGLPVASYLVRNWGKKNTKIILLFSLFTIANSFIFALAPERSGKIAIIDSRDLYLLSIGSIISLLFFLWDTIDRRILYVCISIYLVGNVFLLENQITGLVADGSQRMKILTIISGKYPDLPQKAVFYFESDKAYYGLPESIETLPFQSGFGQTLIISYYQKSTLPQAFLENKFLWDIDSQGYEEFDGRGFGYFREFDALKEAVTKNKIDFNSIIAFRWEKGNLVDDSENVAKRLKAK